MRFRIENIARVRNCPDIAILGSLFGLCLFSSSFFCCLFVFLPFSLDIPLIKCLKGLKFQKSLFMSEF